MFAEINRAIALGAKFGLTGLSMYADASVDTPEIDETALEGAIGIVVTLAAVIVALYVTAIVIGATSKSISGQGWYSNGTAIGSGGMGLPVAWNQTVYGMDSNANSSFSLAGILPIAIIGVGILVIIISAFAMR